MIAELISAILFQLNEHPSITEAPLFAGSIILFMFYGIVTYFLLFKTNYFLNILKLESGFQEETLVFEISKVSILTIALIVIGGLILTNEIPNLCIAIYQYIQEKSIQSFTGNFPDFRYLLVGLVKIILGLLILGERARIVQFIERKTKVVNT